MSNALPAELSEDLRRMLYESNSQNHTNNTNLPADVAEDLARMLNNCRENNKITEELNEVVEDMMAQNRNCKLSERDFLQRVKFASDGRISSWDLRKIGLTRLPNTLLELQIAGDLYLNGNTIGSLPRGIGRFSVGRDLDLGQNQLCELPQEIGGLRVGRDLDLSGNQLASLPPGIANLQVGRDLHLEGGNVGCRFPAETPNLRLGGKMYLDAPPGGKLPSQLRGIDVFQVQNCRDDY